MSDPRPPKSPRKGKYNQIRIVFLNDTVHVFQVPVKGTGAGLWDAVVKHLHLLEADYFDLEYTNHHGDECWLEKDKSVLKQLGSPDVPLRFCVKFYTPDPGLLEDELTRFLFALQVRKDLLRGELRCSENTASLLASYVVQAEIGDFDPDEYGDPTYLTVFKFVPEHLQNHEFMSKVMDYHRQHIGESPSEADLNLLDTARKVELYGVKMWPAKDHESVSLNLAVAHLGVLVFQQHTKINTFSWAKVRKLSFKRKKFLIKLHADTYEHRFEGMQLTPTKSSRGYYKDTVEFFFETRDRCKLFWKRCIEHHAFFRCQMVSKTSRSKSRVVSRGSSFRYSGRTQKQLVEYVRENVGKRPYFERTSVSGRISSRSTSVTPKIMNRPGMHSSSADLQTSSGSRSSGSHILESNHTPNSGGIHSSSHSATRVESVDVHSDSSMSGSRSLNSPRLEHGLSIDQEVIEAVNARTEGAMTDDEDEVNNDELAERNEPEAEPRHHPHPHHPDPSRGMTHVSSDTKVFSHMHPEHRHENHAWDRKMSAPSFGAFLHQRENGTGFGSPHMDRTPEIDNIPETVEENATSYSPPRFSSSRAVLRQGSVRSDDIDDLPPPPPSPPAVSSPSPPPPPPPFEEDLDQPDDDEDDDDIGSPPPFPPIHFYGDDEGSRLSEEIDVARLRIEASNLNSQQQQQQQQQQQLYQYPHHPHYYELEQNQQQQQQQQHHRYQQEQYGSTEYVDDDDEDAGDVETNHTGSREEEGNDENRSNSKSNIIKAVVNNSINSNNNNNNNNNDTSGTAITSTNMSFGDEENSFDTPREGEEEVIHPGDISGFSAVSEGGMSSPANSSGRVVTSDGSILSGQDNTEDEHRRRGRSRPSDRAYYIAKELLMAERTYRKDLEVLCVWFRNAVSCDPAVLNTMSEILFTHLDPIYNYHYSFLKEVELRLAAWEGKTGNPSVEDCQRVGDIVLRAVNVIQELYLSYFDHLEDLLTEMDQKVKKQRPLEDLCRGFESQKVCYLPLNTFFLRPGQRLLHFKLILERLVKHYTINHHDLEDSKEALCRIAEIVNTVKDKFNKLKNLQKLMELQRDLIGLDNLVHLDRDFIREGCLQKFSRKGYQQRMFFLFSDMLVYTSRTSASLLQFKVHGQLLLRGMTVEETDPSKSAVQFSFAIYTGNKYILVAASSQEEKDKWIEDINEAVTSIKTMSADKLQYPSLKSSASSSENVGAGAMENGENGEQSPSEKPLQHRANTTMHVCWHRNTSVSMRDHQMALRNQLSGYLLRKFKTSNGWQKLWVVFTNFSLFFYKTYQDDYPLASLPLLGYSISPPEPEDGIHKDHVFKLQFKNHVYFFRAESEYTFSRWMEVINSATHNARRTRIFSRLDSRPKENS